MIGEGDPWRERCHQKGANYGPTISRSILVETTSILGVVDKSTGFLEPLLAHISSGLSTMVC